MATRTATREIEGRDSVGLYLDEIARTPLLDAITEVELSKTIEAGLLAEHLLAEGRVGRKKGGAPKNATAEELEWLAAELDMDLDRVLDLLSWGREHVSLDTPVDEDGDTSLGDLIAQETAPGPDSTFLDVESKDRLGHLVELLDDRAADIIRSRYGLVDGRQHKLADIGARHGISAERVRQLEREALQKLRRLGDPDLAA